MAVVTTAQFEAVIVNGSAAARSVFNVNGTSGLAQTVLNGGNQNDVFNVGGSTGDLDALGGALNLRGNRGVDRVIVNDSADTGDRTITLSAGSVDRDGAGLISYTGAEALAAFAGTGDDRFALNGAPGFGVTLDGGGGSDTVTAPNQANTFRVTGTNAGTLDFATDLRFSAVENLEGNIHSDTFEFASSINTLTTPRLDGTINGQGGIDTIDYRNHFSQFGFGVEVNLSAETATLTGGVSRVENVEGSRYDDILTGNSEDNVLNGHDGDDFLLGLQGDDTLSGSIGRDILVGGIGADDLDAGVDQDILIGGSITFGANVTDLEDVMNEWQSGGNFLSRVNDLRDGNGLDLIVGSTVNHDTAGDTLTGGTDDLDWFFADGADTRTDPDDNGEQITT
jgi:Ca2+-binding RTX toxin-like protein